MAAVTGQLQLPLVAIVGPTASGKTGLAIDLAKRVGGEIICADSRTVYKHMDIATAKPTAKERAVVPHWGLDLVEPGEYFSAADFKVYALEKIAQIRSRGRVPFLVGGTGLYVDAVLLDYQFGDRADASIRTKLETMSLQAMYKYCFEHNIQLPENRKNKRHVVRAIEQNGINQKRQIEVLPNTIVVGITTENTLLRERIEERAEQLFADGVVEEAIFLGKKYGWQSEAMTANVYPLVHRHLEGRLSLDELKQQFITRDWQLAKRQRTWFKRRDFIEWRTLTEAKQHLEQRLALE